MIEQLRAVEASAADTTGVLLGWPAELRADNFVTTYAERDIASQRTEKAD
jgi:hypothetical protein